MCPSLLLLLGFLSQVATDRCPYVAELENLGATVVRNRKGQPTGVLLPQSGRFDRSDVGKVFQLGSIETLIVAHPIFTDRECGELIQLRSLRRLELSSNLRISSRGMALIGNVPTLEVLSLDNTRLDDQGLAGISRIPTLKELWIRGTDITNAGLLHIRRLECLEVLDVSETDIDSAGLAFIRGHPRIEAIVLDDTGVDDEGLSHLATLQRLTTLYLHDTLVTAQGLSSLRHALPKCRVYWKGEEVESGKRTRRYQIRQGT